ncbi:MAG: FUSC family membrane protein, partial [Draconibacterium sp.]
MEYLQSNLKKLKNIFWRHPDRLFALRSTISMGVLAIPFIVAGKPFFGVTLALGALAGALSETDDHPKGRVKALSITVFSFFISSFAVGLLNNYPWLLGTGFVLSTIVFILMGGLGERYRAITFGSVLVGIYAMLGIEISPAWYWQAVLLPAGALFHGILTLILMYLNPWRLLDEQLAKGFTTLSNYLEKKSMFFPSEEQEQADINKDLALLNISVVNSLEKIKEVLINYGKELSDPEPLRPYLQRFMLLQSLHERAASSHERHDKLSNDTDNLEVMEGFGEMLRQLAFATRQVADNVLTGSSYHHPMALEWISNAIEEKLKHIDANTAQPLVLLHHNLHRSQLSLKYLDNTEEGTAIPRLKQEKRNPIERFQSLLSFKHPRMRYALRLSLSFMIGFILAKSLHLDKGAWVMLTSLFVSQITYSDTRRRLFQRLLGTVT